MFNELENKGMLDDMLLDLWIFKLRRVGRRNMSAEQLWEDWINEN